jgi:DTW domain-containing protein YfiP
MSAACQRCLFQRCLCSEIPTIVTRTRVVIVRHHLERHRSSNTGRLAHLALPNSEIVDHGGRRLEAHDGGGLGGVAVLPPLDGAWLLFPEGDHGVPAEPPKQLVVLDATWSQARRMFRKIAALRGLPILRLPPGPMAASRLREAPGPGMVSTIEAIARALVQLEGTGGDELERLFQVAVGRAAATGRRL